MALGTSTFAVGLWRKVQHAYAGTGRLGNENKQTACRENAVSGHISISIANHELHARHHAGVMSSADGLGTELKPRSYAGCPDTVVATRWVLKVRAVPPVNSKVANFGHARWRAMRSKSAPKVLKTSARDPFGMSYMPQWPGVDICDLHTNWILVGPLNTSIVYNATLDVCK